MNTPTLDKLIATKNCEHSNIANKSEHKDKCVANSDAQIVVHRKCGRWTSVWAIHCVPFWGWAVPRWMQIRNLVLRVYFWLKLKSKNINMCIKDDFYWFNKFISRHVSVSFAFVDLLPIFCWFRFGDLPMQTLLIVRKIGRQVKIVFTFWYETQIFSHLTYPQKHSPYCQYYSKKRTKCHCLPIANCINTEKGNFISVNDIMNECYFRKNICKISFKKCDD